MKMAEQLTLLQVIDCAASRHRHRRRDDPARTPRIVHPLELAVALREVMGCGFGEEIGAVVLELACRKPLPEDERLGRQIEKADGMSRAARAVMLADLLCHGRELGACAPKGWSAERQRGYLAPGG